MSPSTQVQNEEHYAVLPQVWIDQELLLSLLSHNHQAYEVYRATSALSVANSSPSGEQSESRDQSPEYSVGSLGIIRIFADLVIPRKC